MLDIQRLINVVVQLTQAPASGRTFNTALAIGDTDVITGLERVRQYSSYNAVATDLGANSPEAKAAQLYFSQKPQPKTMYIGRWIRTATAGLNLGAILSPAQQLMTNFNAISNGGFNITVDGVVKNVTGLNFLGALNLNAVASIVTGGLSGAGVTWNGSQFIVKSSSTGAGVAATGSVLLTLNPSASDTLTVNGTVVTFVSGTPTGNQVQIGGSTAITAANLWTFLSGSADVNIAKATYVLNGSEVDITYFQVGTAGNAFTLATSDSSAITLSGATLAGGAEPSSVSYATAPGSGTDISSLLGLTAALSIDLVPGYAAETPLQAYLACVGANNAWYFGGFASSVFPSDSDYLAIAGVNEAQTTTRAFGITTQNTGSLSSLVTNDIGSEIEAEGYENSFVEYSSTNPYAVFSIFGRACGVDFTQQNSTITLMYKQMPGVLPEDLSDAEANALQAKNVNVFAEYDNGTSVLQYGTVGAEGGYIDQTQGVDWLQNHIQTEMFNALYTTPTKVPQTDGGAVTLQNAAAGACDDGVFNGLIAPGTWNGPSFGSLQTGQFLKAGFYIFQNSIDSQSEADRVARKAPPMQIAVKLAGAFHTADVLIQVNQ